MAPNLQPTFAGGEATPQRPAIVVDEPDMVEPTVTDRYIEVLGRGRLLKFSNIQPLNDEIKARKEAIDRGEASTQYLGVADVLEASFEDIFVTPFTRCTTSDHSTKPTRAINDDPQHDRHSVKLSARASSRLSKTGDNCLS